MRQVSFETEKTSLQNHFPLAVKFFRSFTVDLQQEISLLN